MSALHTMLPQPLRRCLPPVPIIFPQTILHAGVHAAARRHPEFFSRLEKYQNTMFLLDPLDLSFAISLRLQPQELFLQVQRRPVTTSYDARIAGTLLQLLRLLDGQMDGDALFFSRDITIEGNTAAVVVLRHALDNLDGNLLEEMTRFLGPFAQLANSVLNRLYRKHI